MARVLHDGEEAKTLEFNYRTGFDEMWDDARLKEKYGYETVYGDRETPW